MAVWRIDNASCGTPALFQIGQLQATISFASIAFAHGQLYGITGGGRFRELNSLTFETIGGFVPVATGAADIGGLAYDGAGHWYAIDGATDALYRFDDPPLPNSWQQIGMAGIDFNKNGLEIFGGQLWAALGVVGPPSPISVGRFDLQTGTYTQVWTASPGQGFIGFVTLPARSSAGGDINCDGDTNGLDVAPFVLALTNPTGFAAALPDCSLLNADLSGDCFVNHDDVQPFVDVLLGS